MFLSPKFSFRPHLRVLEVPEAEPAEQVVQDCAVIFVHAEEGDADAESKLTSKVVKNIKWIANKQNVRTVLLHSFNHLSESKADPEFAESFLTNVSGRLEQSGYRVFMTPFGYSCEWELAVHGEPVAKVFKAL